MSGVATKLTKDWQLIPLAATMIFGFGLASFKMYDKVANDHNINLSTKSADVGDWELRSKMGSKEAAEKVSVEIEQNEMRAGRPELARRCFARNPPSVATFIYVPRA